MSKEIFTDRSIVVGCNYHTSWQSHKAMRFVLVEVKEQRAKLKTRGTRKEFWTNVQDLRFILTGHNIQKAKDFKRINTK